MYHIPKYELKYEGMIFQQRSFIVYIKSVRDITLVIKLSWHDTIKMVNLSRLVSHMDLRKLHQ